ncbi:MAG: tRNA-dihydrouridine synthase family protein [Candidatus Nanoarchaeia archaeon]|nr:tRNA-dihydrouridine synthase family protein [Candidatus Nanoarchaeia archaeon]MDD5741458.1 tRNA-dihydrouridine synthase family protein [Candidatus Nanoarchaeia archaeon]
MTKFPVLESKLILAPMHNITNVAFRIMCKKYGASLVSTELLSANAVSREDNLNLKLALTDKKEKPIAAQLFGQNTENLVKAARKFEADFDIIDINFGCPSKKILSQGAGAALLKRKNKIKEIVKEVSNNIKIPLTVKIRNEDAIEVAKICEKAGASAVTVHARSVKQGYSGKADWNVIKKVKENVKIPVIGNGDVVDGKSAERMLKETNCDYIMIGRAAIGNPFIFKQINEYLKTGKEIRQTKKEKIEDYFGYIKLTKEYKIFSINDAKLKAQDFTKGLSGSRELRGKLNMVKSYEKIEKLVKGL